MADQEPEPPQFEGIEIMGLLGTGVTSRVYLANQRRFNRPVAVKVLDQGSRTADVTASVRDEARFLALLSAHPNILTLFDAGVTEDGHTYLVTEFLPAGSYGQRLRTEGPLGWTEVVRVGVQLAGALETSHLHGVVHGDVKPDNVLVGRVGQPLLADFGVAVLLSRSQVAEQTLLTPLHAAPEIFAGEPSSIPADIYGLGSTLQSLLTGRSPAGSPTDPPAVIVARMERGERLPLEAPEAPDDLVGLLETMTAPDPAGRLGTAERVGTALQELEGRNGVHPSEMYVFSDLPSHDAAPADPSAGSAAEATAPPPLAAVAASAANARRSAGVVGSGGADRADDESRAGIRGVPSPIKGALVAIALLMVVALGILGWTNARTGDADGGPDAVASPVVGDGATTRRSTAGSTGDGTDASATSVSVPESSIAGIQPGIVFGGAGSEDTSATIASKVSEEQVVFGQLPAMPVPRPYYGVVLHTLPATFHYQSYNSLLPATCRGMMSREITVVGLWERASTWPGGVLLVAVAQTENEEMAHELATVLSIEVGVDPQDCWGIGDYNVSDYSDYGVRHRDIEARLPEGAVYNVWRQEDLEVGSQTWPHSTRMITNLDTYVIDISLVTEELLPADNDRVVANIAHQVRSRLTYPG